MENAVERHVGDSRNHLGVTTRRSWQPNAARRVSTLRDNARVPAITKTLRDYSGSLSEIDIARQFPLRGLFGQNPEGAQF